MEVGRWCFWGQPGARILSPVWLIGSPFLSGGAGKSELALRLENRLSLRACAPEFSRQFDASMSSHPANTATLIPRKRRVLWLSLAAGAVGLGVIGGALAVRNACGHMVPMTQQQRAAYERSLASVRERLPSPEKARFSTPGEGETWASDLGNRVFISRGTVATPDSAGAMIRQEWQVAYDAAASRVLPAVGSERSGDINAAVAAARIPAGQRL